MNIVKKEGDRLYLQIEYTDYKTRAEIKNIRGWWHNDLKLWSVSVRAVKYIRNKYLKELLENYINEKKEVEEKKENETFQNRIKIATDIYNKYIPKLKPYSHQKEASIRALAYKRYAFLMEMGTGKTKATIDTIEALKDKIKKVLIIAPKSIVENWIEEIKINSDTTYVVLDGTFKQRKNKLEKNVKYYILNYEGVLVLKSLLKDKFDFVVLDESSKIKNPQAKRTKLILKLFENVEYKLILSGTPITQNPIDIYTQYRFLDQRYLGFNSWYAFRNEYCIMGGYGGYQIVGYKNLDDLKRKISKYGMILKKKDCLDLPDKIYENIKIDMEDELAEQYIKMKNDLLLEINDDETITASIILTKILRLQEITSGIYYNGISNKDKELLDILTTNLNGNKAIIWIRFIKTLKKIEKLLDKNNIKYVSFYGDTKDRQEVINTFNNDKTIKVFIGQIQTAGMGINLTSANLVIYYENTFSLQDRLQSEDRTHRIGQKNKVTYIDLVYKNTIDEHILYAIKNKKKISDYLISNKEEVLKND